MKWRKMRYNENANTHRNGWKFWDLLDSDGCQLCMVRFVPGHSDGLDYEVFEMDKEDWYHFRTRKFTTLKKAQDYAVAYFVNKRLEESNG